MISYVKKVASGPTHDCCLILTNGKACSMSYVSKKNMHSMIKHVI